MQVRVQERVKWRFRLKNFGKICKTWIIALILKKNADVFDKKIAEISDHM
jgi:hypothetical protein